MLSSGTGGRSVTAAAGTGSGVLGGRVRIGVANEPVACTGAEETAGGLFNIEGGGGRGVSDSSSVSCVLEPGGGGFDVGGDDSDNEASPWADSLK